MRGFALALEHAGRGGARNPAGSPPLPAVWVQCSLSIRCHWMRTRKRAVAIREDFTCKEEFSPMGYNSPLDLPVPRNLTALMQHLQRLVGPEQHPYWCGGTVPVHKLDAFVHKMADRYPLLRNTRQRSYDRRCGRAVVHMIVYPLWPIASDTRCAGSGPALMSPRTPHAASAGAPSCPESVPRVAWWIVSSAGAGGLQDPRTPDAHVAKDAMSAAGHITLGDYVLLYATKKEPHRVRDPRVGASRTEYRELSTWTWKIRTELMRELRAAIDECCSRLEYGAEPSGNTTGWGLRGLLAAQRARPLFSGVRNQVLELHAYARDAWEARRPLWLTAHPQLAARYGKHAGALRPLADIVANHLPMMSRVRVYDDPPRRIRELLQ